MRSSISSRLTFANVMSVIAVFLALGGGAYAAVKLKKNSVKSRHIAPNAVTGADVNEDTLGQVPNAGRAVQAVRAGNASTVGGQTPGQLQDGNGSGLDFSSAEVIDENQDAQIAASGGVLVFHCDGVFDPTVSWADDDDAGSAPTRFWAPVPANGYGYGLVVDGSTTGTWNLVAQTSGGDRIGEGEFVAWSGDDTISRISVRSFWDNSESECSVAFSVQETVNGA